MVFLKNSSIKCRFCVAYLVKPTFFQGVEKYANIAYFSTKCMMYNIKVYSHTIKNHYQITPLIVLFDKYKLVGCREKLISCLHATQRIQFII